MNSFPLHLELMAIPTRPETSIERELAAMAARVPAPVPRRRRFGRYALRRLFAGTAGPAATSKQITIRTATPVDRRQLERLASLDRRTVPAGIALVAEVEERIVAGVSLVTSEPFSDPFRAGQDVLHLLEVRAAQLAA